MTFAATKMSQGSTENLSLLKVVKMPLFTHFKKFKNIKNIYLVVTFDHERTN